MAAPDAGGEDMKQRVLIVDDNPDVPRFLQRLIEGALPAKALTAAGAAAALRILDEGDIHCVLTDMRMPRMGGMELLRTIRQKVATLPVIIMTAYGAVETAVQSMKEGAYDFITKPFEEERLLHTVRRALEHQRLLKRNTDLERTATQKEHGTFFVGESPRMQELIETIRLVAGTDATVLITGESGTGKQLAARMIHSLSNRSGKPFVAAKCPTIPESLLESELFGYRKGAMSGAVAGRNGLFQAAEGGTLFLDEIGDISPVLQAKLLRTLEERQLKAPGDTAMRSVDVRVIAATNKDLEQSIAEGLFRADLYYRLNVVPVRTPPLRDIPEDIPRIAAYFLSLFCQGLKLDQKSLRDDTSRLLATRLWKGNAWELQNAIKRAVVFSNGALLTPDDFEISTAPACGREEETESNDSDYKKERTKVVASFNVAYLTRLLRCVEGNVTLAAAKAGLERQSLQHLMRRYGILSAAFKKNEHQ
jgi:DNA-binding NtrC family response regulator